MLGVKVYTIEYLECVVVEDIPQIPNNIKVRIKKAIEDRLVTDPIGFGKPLRFSLKGHRRLRVGDYRVVYRIESEEKIVVIIAIKHRNEAYRSISK